MLSRPVETIDKHGKRLVITLMIVDDTLAGAKKNAAIRRYEGAIASSQLRSFSTSTLFSIKKLICTNVQIEMALLTCIVIVSNWILNSYRMLLFNEANKIP